MIDIIRKDGFNASVEVGYLSGLPSDRRRAVLVQELSRAAGEAHRFSFLKEYARRRGMVVDTVSGESLRALLERSQRDEEIRAFDAIEKGVGRSENLVVNFSPANDSFGYPDNVVDVWQGDGDRVTWLRFHVEDGFETMSQTYQELGGATITSREELLSKPIVVEGGVVESVIGKFKVIKEKTVVTQEQITEVAEIIVTDFITKFGKDFVLDINKVFRAYSAVMAETKKMVTGKLKSMVDGVRTGIKNVAEKVKVGVRDLYAYAFKTMVMAIVKTMGCAKSTMVGNFNDGEGGEESSEYFRCPRCNGKIPSGKGIEVCPNENCRAKKSDYGNACD